jgi:hypothetical protein
MVRLVEDIAKGISEKGLLAECTKSLKLSNKEVTNLI